MQDKSSAFGQESTISDNSGLLTPAKNQHRIAWEVFQKRYLSREDGYTYQWTNGVVEKSQNTMDATQIYIQFNIQELFMALKMALKVTGQLLAETDLIFMQGVHRRPDFAWLTQEQAIRLSVKGAIEIPAFVIEVISTNDAAQKISDKMQVYRSSGVQVAWHIYPNTKEIHVYAGPQLKHIEVCTGDNICSAAPALSGFSFKADDVFRK